MIADPSAPDRDHAIAVLARAVPDRPPVLGPDGAVALAAACEALAPAFDAVAAHEAELLRRLRPNGLILVDNTLWGGAITDASNDDESTVAMRAFNDMVAADERVDSALLTLGDGLTLLRKR